MPDPVVHRDGPHTFGQTRDTAPQLGRLIPDRDCTNPVCRDRLEQLHAHADQAALTRDHVSRLIADLAAAERRLAAIEARGGAT